MYVKNKNNEEPHEFVPGTSVKEEDVPLDDSNNDVYVPIDTLLETSIEEEDVCSSNADATTESVLYDGTAGEKMQEPEQEMTEEEFAIKFEALGEIEQADVEFIKCETVEDTDQVSSVSIKEEIRKLEHVDNDDNDGESGFVPDSKGVVSDQEQQQYELHPNNLSMGHTKPKSKIVRIKPLMDDAQAKQPPVLQDVDNNEMTKNDPEGIDNNETTTNDPDSAEQDGRILRSNTTLPNGGMKNTRRSLCRLCPETFETAEMLRYHIKCRHARDKGCTCDLCDKVFASRRLLEKHKITHSNEVQCPNCYAGFPDNLALQVHMVQHIDPRTYNCRLCGIQFDTRKLLRVHQLDLHPNGGIPKRYSGVKTFQCDLCRHAFHTQIRLDTHKRAAHGDGSDKRFVCTMCGKRYSTGSKLRMHLMHHTGERPYKCKHCQKGFITRWQLAIHDRVHTGERPFGCDKCAKAFISKEKLLVHFRVHSGIRFPCIYCEKTYSSKEQQRQHMLTHTAEKTFECDVCEKRFVSRTKLRMHMRTHITLRTFPCRLCNATFPTSLKLEGHVRVHGERPFECHDCGKLFVTKELVQSHISYIHMGLKPFVCAVCGKRFVTKHKLAMHVRSHTGEKPYVCSDCDKAFSTRYKLNVHERTHTGERPFPCTACEKAFISKDKLQMHMRMHSGERPYVCEYCQKSFIASHKLKMHKRIHQNDKRFRCEHCEKSFISAYKLRVHVRTHTGEKPFACLHCDKAFISNDKLRVHMWSHTGDKPFACGFCSHKFISNFKLQKHLSTHADETMMRSVHWLLQ